MTMSLAAVTFKPFQHLGPTSNGYKEMEVEAPGVGELAVSRRLLGGAQGHFYSFLIGLPRPKKRNRKR